MAPGPQKMKRTKNASILHYYGKEIHNETGDTASSVDPPPTQGSNQNSSSPINTPRTHETINTPQTTPQSQEGDTPSNERLSQNDVISLTDDPGKRTKITEFHPNDRALVRREYIRRGLHQPKDYVFPQTTFGTNRRRFNADWYKKFEPWLEYSIELDAAFCFACYLFKSEVSTGENTFISGGFRTWSKPRSFDKHVGGRSSAHNKAVERLEAFKSLRVPSHLVYKRFS